MLHDHIVQAMGVVVHLPAWLNSPFHWTRRRRVQFTRDSAGEIGQSAGVAGMAHGVGHTQWVFSVGNTGVEEDAVAAQLHGHGHVAGSANPGVHDYRILRITMLKVFEDNPDVV